MMAGLYSTRRLTRTAGKPGPFTVSRHDAQDGYSIHALSVTPRACPAGRIVTLATGSACSHSAATRACPASCTATACFSAGGSTFEPSRRPSRIRSLAASKPAPVSTSRPPRTATIAALAARLARSAPEKPGPPVASGLIPSKSSEFCSAACSARSAPLTGSCRRRRYARSWARPAGGPGWPGPVSRDCCVTASRPVSFWPACPTRWMPGRSPRSCSATARAVTRSRRRPR